MSDGSVHATSLHATSGSGGSAPDRIATGGLDTTHGVVLYLDDISVSFDGFQGGTRVDMT